MTLKTIPISAKSNDTGKELKPKGQTITAALIVKNEQDHILRCLESLKDMDEIVIIDTGSSDGTLDIIREFHKGRPVTLEYSKFFNGDTPIENFDFATARNEALELATCDWVLSVDADETLIVTGDVKKELLRHESALLLVKNISPNVCFAGGRMFRRDPHLRWYRPIHEHIVYFPNPPTPDGIYATRAHQIDGIVPIVQSLELHHTSCNRVPKRNRNITLLNQWYSKTGDQEALLYLAQDYEKKGELFAAIGTSIAHFAHENRTDDFDFSHHKNLGLCYGSLAHINKAVDHFTQAIAIESNDLHARLKMAQLLNAAQRHAAALVHLDVALEISYKLPNMDKEMRIHNPSDYVPSDILVLIEKTRNAEQELSNKVSNENTLLHLTG